MVGESHIRRVVCVPCAVSLSTSLTDQLRVTRVSGFVALMSFGRAAEYCDERVSLSVRSHISGKYHITSHWSLYPIKIYAPKSIPKMETPQKVHPSLIF